MRNTLARNKKMPTFFGEIQLKGERINSNFNSALYL
jgi:hypothetical protein